MARWLQHFVGDAEESPYSIGHDTGEIPEWGNLLDRATETYRRFAGKGEKVV